MCDVDDLAWCNLIAHSSVVSNHKITKDVVLIVPLVVEMQLLQEVKVGLSKYN